MDKQLIVYSYTLLLFVLTDDTNLVFVILPSTVKCMEKHDGQSKRVFTCEKRTKIQYLKSTSNNNLYLNTTTYPVSLCRKEWAEFRTCHARYSNQHK